MANTVGTPGYIGQVTQMTAATPAYGPTFDAIHQQLLNNDAFLNQEIMSLLQKSTNSGVIDYASGTSGFNNAVGAPIAQLQVGAASQGANEFLVGKFAALINGYLLNIVDAVVGSPFTSIGSNHAVNAIQIDPPPTVNVTPSLTGSSRDDFVFIEVWLDPTTAVPKWRIRYASGVDFATNPEGFTPLNGQGGAAGFNLNLAPQGGNSVPPPAPGTNSFAKCFADYKQRLAYPTYFTNMLNPGDTGLYTAGDGSSTAQSFLNTYDGYVYAIPLFRIRRRNNGGFNPDNNPLGGRNYYTVNGSYSTSAVLATGASESIIANSTDLSNFQIGDVLSAGPGYLVKITSISGSTVTYENLSGTMSNPHSINSSWYLVSDRPDGLFANIIDASDIVDIRHQISITGFSFEALLEKNLDLLMKGQLTTSSGTRYGRDYIGLNLPQDDANTLLYLPLNGNTNATANGAPVAIDPSGTFGTVTFANGIQGLAGNFTSPGASLQYPVPISLSQGAVELFIKNPTTTANGNAIFTIIDSNGLTMITLFTSNGHLSLNYSDTSSTRYYLITPSTGLTNFPLFMNDNVWRKIKLEWDSSGVYLYVDDILIGSTSTTLASISQLTGRIPASFSLGRMYTFTGASSYDYSGYISSVRVSNIRRPATLPSNYNYANGDKLLDGPGGDFFQWSDDLGGTSGVNGRTNPYGLSRVPNPSGGRVNVNGSEIRHYFTNMWTSGWTSNGSNAGVNPTGDFSGEDSAEYFNSYCNEAIDGVRTTFTFSPLPNINGIPLSHAGYTQWIRLNGNYITPSSITINPLTGLITATFSTPPASGSSLYIAYTSGARHAHFIPCTKGFVIHDWTDDSITADGTTKVFQTSKYAVTAHNHVRSTATGGTAGSVQNGGYSYQGLNVNTTLAANSAANATTITVASAVGMLIGQNLRISNGNGVWVTCTIQGIVGTTITVSALTAAVSSGAIVQGAMVITFTTAPVTGTVDIVYESIYVPSATDYIRVMYQHVPYQGLQIGNTCTALYVSPKMTAVSFGTGKLNIPTAGKYTTPITPNLPIGNKDYDYAYKSDALSNVLFSTGRGTDFVLNSGPTTDNPSSTIFYPLKEGVTVNVQSVLGARGGVTDSGGYVSLMGVPLAAAFPHMAVVAAIVADNSSQELYLFVAVQGRVDVGNIITVGGGTTCSVDIFKLPGRPLIKNYGGVTA